jgi:hypothetical protein
LKSPNVAVDHLHAGIDFRFYIAECLVVEVRANRLRSLVKPLLRLELSQPRVEALFRQALQLGDGKRLVLTG